MIVLIVDDDPEDREILSEVILEINPSIGIIEANDGIGTMSMLLAGTTSLPGHIFLDINMPRMNGFDTLAALKQNASLKHIPVVMYSTSTAAKDVETSMQLGADKFIAKATSFESLRDSVKGYFAETDTTRP